MKIYIESSAIFAERSGIGQYTKRLIESYHRQYPAQKLKLFGFRLIYRSFLAPIPKDSTLGYRLIRWLPGRIYTGSFKKGIKIPMDALLGATTRDVFLFPNFVKWPLLYNRQSIAVIHDVSFVTHGQYSSPANRDYMLKYVPKTIANIEHIITISESSKRDIVKHFGADPNNISIVNPFIDLGVFKRKDEKSIMQMRKKYKLPEKYFLFMSTMEPRKNISGLLDAYEKLPRSITDEYKLVLAGGKGWLNDDIHIKVDELVKNGLNIIRTGYIDDEDLPALYSGASLYTFIPHYEGFGISPLEAMACGVPVITSDNSSLPEVVGKAGLLVSAAKPEQTTKAIMHLLAHPEICNKMIREGYLQAAKFNPIDSAKQLQKAIEKVS